MDMYLYTVVQPCKLLKDVHPNSSHLIITTLNQNQQAAPRSLWHMPNKNITDTHSSASASAAIASDFQVTRNVSQIALLKKVSVGFLSFTSPQFLTDETKKTNHKNWFTTDQFTKKRGGWGGCREFKSSFTKVRMRDLVLNIGSTNVFQDGIVEHRWFWGNQRTSWEIVSISTGLGEFYPTDSNSMYQDWPSSNTLVHGGCQRWSLCACVVVSFLLSSDLNSWSPTRLWDVGRKKSSLLPSGS